MRGKTIEIFLPDGDARSIKEAEVRESHIRAVFIPRSKIADAEKLPDVNGSGIYFLFGEQDELGRPSAYIGESEEMFIRLKQHNADTTKDYWNIAIFFSSVKAHLNKAAYKYLENYCYEQAKSKNKCVLKNGNVPKRSSVSRSDENTVLHFFDDLKLLLSALGFPILEGTDDISPEDRYYMKVKGAEAVGVFGVEGFTVLQGSHANVEEVPSFVFGKKMREQLVHNNILKREGNLYVFTQDFTFKTPSGAGDAVAGRSTNGWTTWKTKNGKTLDDAVRKKI